MIYCCTLLLGRTHALVRLDVLEPAGLLRHEPMLSISTTWPNGAVEVEQVPFQPPSPGLTLEVAAIAQAISGMTFEEVGGGRVDVVHYPPELDPSALEAVLSGVNLAWRITELATTRTVQ